MKTSLRRELLDHGATVVGIADLQGFLSGEIAHLGRAVSIGVDRRLNEDTLSLLVKLEKRAVRFLKARGHRTLAIPPDSDLVCLSAMMTTTMTGMKKVIDDLRKKNPNVKIMLGGAPVSQDVADKYGADGYAKDASNALKDAINMVSSLKKLKDEAEAKKKAK